MPRTTNCEPRLSTVSPPSSASFNNSSTSIFLVLSAVHTCRIRDRIRAAYVEFREKRKSPVFYQVCRQHRIRCIRQRQFTRPHHPHVSALYTDIGILVPRATL